MLLYQVGSAAGKLWIYQITYEDGGRHPCKQVAAHRYCFICGPWSYPLIAEIDICSGATFAFVLRIFAKSLFLRHIEHAVYVDVQCT